MSRSRASSAAAAAEFPVLVRCVRVPRPFLLNAHNVEHPQRPPLPQMEPSLPRTPQPMYVGEKCQIALVVERKSGFTGALSGLVNAYLVQPSGKRADAIRVLNTQFTLEEEKEDPQFAAFDIEFDIVEPGVWTVVADVYCGGRSVSQQFPLQPAAGLAISVRTKVSKGSPGVGGEVLETQVENQSESTLLIESCILAPENEWQVTSVALDQAAPVLLRPRDVHQYSFVLRNGVSPEAGSISVAWRREPLGAKGWQKTGVIKV